jgi:hypothetical protein
MGRLPTWLIVAAVGALVALAAADALRPADESSPATPVAEASTPNLEGVLVVGPRCSVRALRLPDLLELQAPRQTDCGGLVWSDDGTLNASCADGYTDVGTSEGRRAFRLRGCAPAWRPDGALSVIRDGDLVVVRRRGRPQVFLSREGLADALAGELQGGGTYRLVEVAWHGSVSFFAIASGPEAWQQAVIVYTPEGLTDVMPQLGQPISSLHVSPSGNFVAIARSAAGRELVMLTATGQEVSLPRIGNARAIAWSPDEQWVALATRTATFIARNGTRRVVRRISAGGDTLAWLP